MVQTLLEENDEVLGVCEGTVMRPNDNNANAEKLKTYLKNDKMELIMNCTLAQQMWTKLNNIYNSKSEACKDTAQQEFFSINWIDSESVVHNLLKVELIGSKLKSHGSEVSDGMLCSVENSNVGAAAAKEPPVSSLPSARELSAAILALEPGTTSCTHLVFRDYAKSVFC